jgi:SRSO17 transposase
MTLSQIARLGHQLVLYLALFDDCFGRSDARKLLRVYVNGQLSDLHRKTAEAIALKNNRAPRTLQRFLESVKWDDEKARNRCHEIIATEHTHPEAIGCVDESGIAKSGKQTTGVARQWNGSRGKVDNAVVAVHLSYSIPGFQTLLDSRLYLPKEWADDMPRQKKVMFPKRSSFRRNNKLHLIKFVSL